MAAIPATMRGAIFLPDGGVEMRDVPMSEPEAGGVMLRVRACGICGSDLHGLRGAWPPRPFPVGHEIAGEVIAAGPGSGVAVGDHVAVEPTIGCGRCRYCEGGNYNHCLELRFVGGSLPGGYAEYVTVPLARNLHRLPSELPWDVAAMTEPLAVGVHALRLAGVACGMSVAVVGGGTIGLLALAAARAMGATRTTLLAKYPHQAERAERLGADLVALTEDTDATARLSAALDGGADVVIEAVGARSNAPQQSLELVRKMGTVVLTGVFTGPVQLEANKIVGKEARVLGSNCYSASIAQRRDFQITVDLLARGAVDAAAVITHRYPLSEAPAAFATSLDKRSGVVKAVLMME